MSRRFLVAAGISAVVASTSCVLAADQPRSANPVGPGKSVVMHAGASVREGFPIWDQGYPNLVDGNEMTRWIQAENFYLEVDTNLTACRFWTVDFPSPGFDGTLEWWIHEDAGGAPGAVVYSGVTGVSRFATGRSPSWGGNEYENEFGFGGVSLPAGNYYLALHMSSDCTTRDEIYWETSDFGIAPAGVENYECKGFWDAFYPFEHAFQLFGKPACGTPETPINPDPPNFATNVPFNDVTLRWNLNCQAGNIPNGGFENGDFSNWNAVTNIPKGGSELTPWNINGFGWFGNAYPYEGNFYAQNGFDGSAGVSYELWRDVYVPDSQSVPLVWRDRIQWDMITFCGGGGERGGRGNPCTQPRRYTVTVQSVARGGGSVVLHYQELSPGTAGDTGYVTHVADLAALGFGGQIVRLHWSQEIPEFFTGPAQFEIDAVELPCEEEVPPPSLREINPLRVTLSNEAFEAKKAKYQSVQSGEFRSMAQAAASKRFAAPASPSAAPPAAKAIEPITIGPAPQRGVPALFNGGGPDFLNGNEMTLWIQGEDFDLPAPATVQYIRFWTIEFGPWDGTCVVRFYADDSGVPGNLIFASLGNVQSRSDLGDGYFEYWVEVPGGANVPAGRSWVGLHMSSDCSTRDEIYWATTSKGYGAAGHEDLECISGLTFNNGQQHAFELYGTTSDCPIYYDVYLRSLEDAFFTLRCGGITTTECNVGRLNCDTDYEWVVVAYSPAGYTVSNYWRFRTAVCCCPGDANGDRTVNFADITKVLEQWLMSCP